MKMKLGKIEDINTVLKVYWIFTALTCLIFPSGISCAYVCDIEGNHIPIFKWVSDIPLVQGQLKMFFIFTWAVMPVWLVFGGYVYATKYSTHGVSLAALMGAWVILLLLTFALFVDVDVYGSDSLWRLRILNLAATSRIVGALVWPGLLYLAYAILFASLIKLPIDLFNYFRSEKS